MDTEYFAFEESSQRQAVKQPAAHIENVCISILSETFVIESIDLCNLSSFVIPAQNRDSLLKAHLECNQ